MFFIYQTQDNRIHAKPVEDVEKAKQLMTLIKQGRQLNIKGETVHVVGLGSRQDLEKLKEIAGQKETQYTHFEQFKKNVDYYKKHGHWPS